MTKTGTHYVMSDSSTYRAVKDGDLRASMDLGDFLMGVGIVLRLPGKKRAGTAPEVIDQIQTTQRRSPIVTGALASVILVAIAATVAALLPTRSDPIPPRLIGSWQTQSPKFANRGFEITGKQLRMKRGPAETDVASLPIQRVRVDARGSDTYVAIEYLEGGAHQSLDLTMHDFAGATALELRNQPDVIWRRARSASASRLSPEALGLPPGALDAPQRR